jgi:hypothetical protein
MRLVIHSSHEAVLDIDDIKVLFINSNPVAMVKRKDRNRDVWEGYKDSSVHGEVDDYVSVWFGDYTVCKQNTGFLDSALEEVLRVCL